MTMAITYDMQKLGEAVRALSLGNEPLKHRLRDTIIFLSTLRSAGLHNRERADMLESIYERLTGNSAISELSDDEARQLARDIVELEQGVWYDAVYELEDRLREGTERR